MAKTTKSEPPKNSQRQRFTEAARELECDDVKERFEKRLGKIAKAKPGEKKR
jgi:hypothetical protein